MQPDGSELPRAKKTESRGGDGSGLLLRIPWKEGTQTDRWDGCSLTGWVAGAEVPALGWGFLLGVKYFICSDTARGPPWLLEA